MEKELHWPSHTLLVSDTQFLIKSWHAASSRVRWLAVYYMHNAYYGHNSVAKSGGHAQGDGCGYRKNNMACWLSEANPW